MREDRLRLIVASARQMATKCTVFTLSGISVIIEQSALTFSNVVLLINDPPY